MKSRVIVLPNGEKIQDRRCGINRREYICYLYYVPERRSGVKDRRKTINSQELKAA